MMNFGLMKTIHHCPMVICQCAAALQHSTQQIAAQMEHAATDSRKQL